MKRAYLKVFNQCNRAINELYGLDYELNYQDSKWNQKPMKLLPTERKMKKLSKAVKERLMDLLTEFVKETA